MFNIKRNGRSDFLLGCSVNSRVECMIWRDRYAVMHPEFKFRVVETNYPGDMIDLNIDDVVKQIRESFS